MTSFSPVALGLGEGADFRAPLGRAIIGGVITSTLLTLLVIPAVYELMDRLRSGVMSRAKRLLTHRENGSSGVDETPH